MLKKSLILSMLMSTLPLLLFSAGCGKTTTKGGAQRGQASSPTKADKFSVAFSAVLSPNGDSVTGPASSSTPDPETATDGAVEKPPSRGAIVGVVKWNGPLPALDPVFVSKDAHVCAEHGRQERPSERLIASPSNGGIRNSVVYLSGKFEDGKPLSELEYPDTLNQRTCSYEPRVFVMPVGARLTMTSEDEVGHNVHMSGAVDLNIAVSKGGRSSRRLEQAGLVKIGCDIHPWMTGYIHVVRHPYYAVTAADGQFELSDVPAGTHQIRLWHEAWWTEDGKLAEPLVVTESVTVRAGQTTRVVFEFSDPAQTRMAGSASPNSRSKQVR